ncbi:MAG: glycyl-radical enzyme activating protein [Planctomycetota bacterium]
MGMIFDIKRFALHDGPGIRTTVFFKGCPLRCNVCHNPESQSFRSERFFRSNRCRGCGACETACKPGAVRMHEGSPLYDSGLCLRCGACATACVSEAVEIAGWEIDSRALSDLIGRDRIFFDESGGGVTFSGGEPLSQPDFLLETLKRCKAGSLHTAVDTSGYADWKTVDLIRPYTDLFLYDLKIMDEKKHRTMTGVPNSGILDNLGRLCETQAEILIRFPLIPGINDDEENLGAMGAFIKALPFRPDVEILPLHTMGREKYARLGRKNSFPQADLSMEKRCAKAADLLQSFGLALILKGDTHAHD